MGHRDFDNDEIALFEAIQEGARAAVDAGAASLRVVWKTLDDGREYPEFVVEPVRGGAVSIAYWLDLDHRWQANVAIAYVAIGGSEVGCVGWSPGTSYEDLLRGVTQLTRGLVHGRVVLSAHRASPLEYDPPPPEGAFTVWVHNTIETPHGKVSSATRTYLERPDAFEKHTGIALGQNKGSGYRLPAYAPALDEGDRRDLGASAGPGSVAVEVVVGHNTDE